MKRDTHRVDRYKLISFTPTEDYWAWFKDDDGTLGCEKVDGLGVVKWWSIVFENNTGRRLKRTYLGERVVGVYVDREDGELFAHECDNYVGICKTGIVPTINEK